MTTSLNQNSLQEILNFEGTNLKIYSLSRADLLFTKIKAFYSRETNDDLDDLMSLGFSIEEVLKTFEEIAFSDTERSKAILNKIKAEYEKD